MAIEQSIIEILEQLAAEFNAKEQRAISVQVRVEPGHPNTIAKGRGNYDAGRRCVYDLFLKPGKRSISPYHLIQVSHFDDRPYPAYDTISDPQQEHPLTSQDALKEYVSQKLDSDEVSQKIESLLR
jgi:hypothetical protein